MRPEHCRTLLKIILTAALVVTTVFNQATAQTQKPNIILILGDDLGYRSLTCDGGNLYSTPNLDAMAQQGMRFAQCHASPFCSPSRFSLMTGKYNFRNYVSSGDMDTAQRTIGNMMKDAGYRTGCFGKWQFGGGDQSVHKFGFEDYCIYNPFEPDEKGDRYKSPKIYTNGAFVSSDLTQGKYSEDIFTDSVISFIDGNATVPFFIYYPMALVHGPWQPTPDDTEFANWDPQASDKSFYPSMVKYMDKKIGEIITHLKNLGIAKNTVVMYSADNGSSSSVADYFDGDSLVYGGKDITTEQGTHVPLIVLWDGTAKAGSVNNDPIDFTDFLPTVAGIANIPTPTDYGPLDGVSFAPLILGNSGTPRKWIFNHYDPHPAYNTYQRWAQNATYKLYDTSFAHSQRLFYNIVADPTERSPIPDNLLSDPERKLKQQFLDAFTSYISQGFALFQNPEIGLVTDQSADIACTIDIDGGSGITARGVVWSVDHDPTLSAGNYTLNGTGNGKFGATIKGLKSNTTYYVRTYATNIAGTAYSKEDSFTTARAFPVATPATLVDERGFTANWKKVDGAVSYLLDISRSATFNTYTNSNVTEGFDSGSIAPPRWYINKEITADTVIYGDASPSLHFRDDGVKVITQQFGGGATRLSFWIKSSNQQSGSMLVEGFDGLNWNVVDNIINPQSQRGTTKVYNATSTPPLPNDLIKFRFTFLRDEGAINLDDVSINYAVASPSYIPGYFHKPVTDTANVVSSLAPNVDYYYRVAAVYDTDTSGYSNVISVHTCSSAVINRVSATDLKCNSDASGAIDLEVTGHNLSYDWTGTDGFTSNQKSIKDLAAGKYQVTVISNGGCAIDTNVTLTEPAPLVVSANAGTISQMGGTATVAITATGGTGGYTGTGDFIQSAGTRTYRVTDANGCTASLDVTLRNPTPPAVVGFPNPTHGTVTLIFPLEEAQQCFVTITDIAGKVLLRKSIDGLAGGNIIDLDMRSFASGIYLISLINNEERKTIKVIRVP